MCGIAGVIDPRKPAAESLTDVALRMAKAIEHRGPDDEGSWCNAGAGLAFGHRRLSIVDLSAAGHQPMSSVCGRYVLSYNGEIYNHVALRAELESAGFREWRGHSDTEVFLASLTHWGVEEALKRANGMFAMAIWDAHEGTVVLARDRMGEKPLYYGWIGPVLGFASELKALRAHPDWSAGLDRNSVTLFLRYAYVPSPFSIYEGIRKLPAASLLRIPVNSLRRGELPEPVAYWSAHTALERGLSEPLDSAPQASVDALNTLLRDAVRIRMEADVPLGAFLSGGTDSSVIVALMQAQSQAPVRTFTIGFEEHGFDEASQARAVAAVLGTDHTELYVTGSEARAVIPALPAMYDEPFADSSQIPTHLVSRLARKSVTVALSGDGGDELFGGYTRYRVARNLWSKARWIPRGVRRAAAYSLGVREGHGGTVDSSSWWMPSRFRETQAGKRVQKVGRVLMADGPHDLYLRLVSHWNSPEGLVIGAKEPSSFAATAAHWPARGDISSAMMYLDQRTYLPDDILVKVDRASMAVGLEARVPFLDHRVVEFAWRLPLEVKLRNGTGKWILKSLLGRHLPRHLVDHPKMGFGIPLGAWLRGPLSEWAQDLLSEDSLRRSAMLNPAPVRQAWSEHSSGRFDREHLLWTVLMLQSWLAAHQP
jgi:asparagine synthase (glutamine-hydrolysing)